MVSTGPLARSATRKSAAELRLSFVRAVMGKAEGSPLITDKMPWHGHVTAVTVDPDYRRLGLADGLMHGLEEISEKTHNAFFVDLFVRVSNTVAVRTHQRLRHTARLRCLTRSVPRAD